MGGVGLEKEELSLATECHLECRVHHKPPVMFLSKQKKPSGKPINFIKAIGASFCLLV